MQETALTSIEQEYAFIIGTLAICGGGGNRLVCM